MFVEEYLPLDFLLKTFEEIKHNYIRYTHPEVHKIFEDFMNTKNFNSHEQRECYCCLKSISFIFQKLKELSTTIELAEIYSFLVKYFNEVFSNESIIEILNESNDSHLYYHYMITQTDDEAEDLYSFVMNTHTILLTFAYLIEIHKSCHKNVLSVLEMLTKHLDKEFHQKKSNINFICLTELTLNSVFQRLSSKTKSSAPKIETVQWIFQICHTYFEFNMIAPWNIFEYKEMKYLHASPFVCPMLNFEIENVYHYLLKPHVTINDYDHIKKILTYKDLKGSSINRLFLLNEIFGQ